MTKPKSTEEQVKAAIEVILSDKKSYTTSLNCNQLLHVCKENDWS